MSIHTRKRWVTRYPVFSLGGFFGKILIRCSAVSDCMIQGRSLGTDHLGRRLRQGWGFVLRHSSALSAPGRAGEWFRQFRGDSDIEAGIGVARQRSRMRFSARAGFSIQFKINSRSIQDQFKFNSSSLQVQFKINSSSFMTLTQT